MTGPGGTAGILVAGCGEAVTASGGGGIACPTGGAFGATGGGVAQPAKQINPMASQQWRWRMEWILLEAAVALGLGLFIAWWLMRGKNHSPRERKRDE